MTTAPTLTFIPDLVEEHFDDLQFLWAQRRDALRSPSYTIKSVTSLEERIEGHADGVLVIGERLGEFVEPALAGDNDLPAFAAGLCLLKGGAPGAQRRVAEAFAAASGPKLAGLRDAVVHGPAKALASQLTALFASAPAPVAAAAGEALLFHGVATPGAEHLERFLRAEEASARAGGWRLAAYAGCPISPTLVEAGLRDDDVTVKQAALTAASWNASPVFAVFCRGIAAKPTPEVIDPLTLFASVAAPEDYQLIGTIATSPTAGPNRFRAVGAFAHPYFIDLLIKEMENPDPATALAAANAFFKMTGRDVESNTRSRVSPDGKPPADDFEAEFQDEVFLPDPELARRQWHELAPTLARSPRICGGLDVSQPLSREQFAALDMESRWEYCLRMRLFSGWQGTPLVLERYPQRF